MRGECRCGHPAGTHEHYRPVTDCAISGCDCGRFRRDWHVGETIAGAAAYVTWSVIAWVEARVGRRR